MRKEDGNFVLDLNNLLVFFKFYGVFLLVGVYVIMIEKDSLRYIEGFILLDVFWLVENNGVLILIN